MNEQLFKRADDALFSEVGNDIVALNVQRGQCYGMENVSAVVWSMLEEPTSLDSICNRLTELYEVEPDVCRAEIGGLVAVMESEGLVERLPAQAA